tara:strand:+ start:1103 stop:1231 length:129 start_codon:yes stop_codon:yes gene_type:complete
MGRTKVFSVGFANGVHALHAVEAAWLFLDQGRGLSHLQETKK